MTITVTPHTKHQRINPFLFPADTTLRFILLICYVIGAGLFIYSEIYVAIPANRAWIDAIDKQCYAQVTSTHQNDIIATNIALFECRAPAGIIRAWWMLAGTVLLLLTAGLLYWFWPRWSRHKEKLVVIPYDDVDREALVQRLEELRQRVGLKERPVLLGNRDPRISGKTLGRMGEYYLVLNLGLQLLFLRGRHAEFDAIVLHEYAHLYNRDVDKTYITMAIFWAFLLVALPPYLIIGLIGNLEQPMDLLHVGWRALVLTALVYLSRNAVLRVREFYADARAASWGAGPTLQHLLQKSPTKAPEPGKGVAFLQRFVPPRVGTWLAKWLPHKWLQHWHQAVHHHPHPQQRIQAIDAPHQLFHTGFWMACATGIACVSTLMIVAGLFYLLLSPRWIYTSLLVASLVPALLIGGIVWLAIWRRRFAVLAGFPVPPLTWRVSLGLGLGLVIGSQLAFPMVRLARSPIALPEPFTLAFDLAWSLLMIGSALALLAWISTCIDAWVEVFALQRRRWIALSIGLLLPSFILALWLSLMFGVYFGLRLAGGLIPIINFSAQFQREFFIALAAQQMGISLSDPLTITLLVGFGLLLLLIINPLTLVVTVVLWALPFAARWGRKRSDTTIQINWALLEPETPPLLRDLPEPLQPMMALRVGVGAALLFGLLALPALRIFYLMQPQSPLLVFLGMGGIALPAALLPIPAAIVATVRARRSAWIHGMMAAFVAGLGTFPTIFVTLCAFLQLYAADIAEVQRVLNPIAANILNRPTFDLISEALWAITIMSTVLVLNGGALLALLSTLITAGIRRLLQAKAQAPQLQNVAK